MTQHTEASPDRRDPFTLMVISAGTSDPSSTRLLADRTASSVAEAAESRGGGVTTTVVDLRQIAAEITQSLTSRVHGPGLSGVISDLSAADGLIVSTPVYDAGPSGLFTSFFQALDDDLLIATPVILAATAGTARHALVVDEHMRSMFAYLRALTVPTSLFAASEDWNDTRLGRRIDRAAIELVLLMESGFTRQVREISWSDYRHEYGSPASGPDVDVDSDMMRLAAGGSLVEDDEEDGLGH